MASLERPRLDTTNSSTDSATLTNTRQTPADSAVPTPFPHDQARAKTTTTTRQDSRSPSVTRRQSLSRGVSGMMDKVKRVMSASRDRGSSGGSSGERDRGRSSTAVGDGATTDEPRGRTGASVYATEGPLTKTMTNTTNATSTMTYPLSATTSRSTSRGRLAPALSTGRGGAGNMKFAQQEGVTPKASSGEEPVDIVRQARVDRSTSREREGRPEVVASGRGGAGNMRSGSRGRDLDLGRVPTVAEEAERFELEKEEKKEKEVLEKYEKETAKKRVWATGRGGAGNIRSPDRSGGNVVAASE